MKSLWFTATLKADTVISENSATTGGHSSLDYIPGACFLGASAGRLYTTLGDEAFTAFHSGQVRFGNAYPLDRQGNRCFPAPLSWHVAKGESPDKDQKLQTPAITNRAIKSWQDRDERQPKQVRDGYFSLSGAYIKPTRQFRLKTAIDRTKGGRAQDAQLFGYESLVAGSQWTFHIDFDDEVNETVISAIGKAFNGQTIRVGRSRSAEFGQLNITQSAELQQPRAGSADARILLYCVSDLALRDPENGAPTLIPTGEQFGLENATLAPNQTFLRSRSYAPFNSKRGANDLERQVLCKGSVLAFDLKSPLTSTELEQLQQRLANGVGLYRQDGLGQLLANPEFLVDAAFKPQTETPPETDDKTNQADQPLTPGAVALTAWLEEQQSEQTLQREAENLARTWLQQYQADLDKHRGPGRSQWGNLRTLAESTPNSEELHAKLFDQKQGLCHHGVSREAWGQELYANGCRQSFAALLEDQVKTYRENPALLQKALYLLGKMAAHRINQKEAA